MAKQCIEYKMHLNPEGRLMVPPWITDPGYYKSVNTFIGFTPIESEREFLSTRHCNYNVRNRCCK